MKMTDGERLLGGLLFCRPAGSHRSAHLPTCQSPGRDLRACPLPAPPGGDHSILPLSLALVYVSVPAASRLPTPVCTRPPCLRCPCLMLCGLCLPLGCSYSLGAALGQPPGLSPVCLAAPSLSTPSWSLSLLASLLVWPLGLTLTLSLVPQSLKSTNHRCP